MISDTKGIECAEASMTFICSWYKRRWPASRKPFVPVSVGSQGIFEYHCFDQIPVVDLPPLARQVESCLMSFAKRMNLMWTSYGDDTFEPDFEAQASAFFHLAKGIKDAMDEIPDNIRVCRRPQDELVLAVEALTLERWGSMSTPGIEDQCRRATAFCREIVLAVTVEIS